MLKRILSILAAMLLVFALAAPALANSTLPPTLSVKTEGLPEGAELFLASADGKETVKGLGVNGTYSFDFVDHHDGLPTLIIRTGDSEHTFEVTDVMLSFGASLTYAEGEPELTAQSSNVFRLVLTNMILTLVLEFIVLLLFGYRKGRTFLIFLIANLLTQALYNTLLVLAPFDYNFLIELLVAEAVIIIVEGLIYSLTVAVTEKKQSPRREHSRGRAWGYAITANLVSMVIGTIISLIVWPLL